MSEASLAGMKTRDRDNGGEIVWSSEAYLEGMKTALSAATRSGFVPRPKPTSKEWKLRIGKWDYLPTFRVRSLPRRNENWIGGGDKKITRFVRSLPRRNENDTDTRAEPSFPERPKPTSKEWKRVSFCVPKFIETGPKPTSKEWKLASMVDILAISLWSEAYLEGMKTIFSLHYRRVVVRVRSLPRRNENFFSSYVNAINEFLSEAYLEGMKT